MCRADLLSKMIGNGPYADALAVLSEMLHILAGLEANIGCLERFSRLLPETSLKSTLLPSGGTLICELSSQGTRRIVQFDRKIFTLRTRPGIALVGVICVGRTNRLAP